MLTDLFNIFIIVFFVAFGLTRPHIALCSVIWVDLYKPQDMSYGLLAGKPLSFILTLFFFTSLVLNLKKVRFPQSKLFIFLNVFFMFWITLTTFNAQFEVAWVKYDIAIKTLFFAIFIPFVVINKEQAETFIWIIIATFGSFVFSAGVKTVFGGGGYGTSLVGQSGFMFSEGSFLANQGISLIPILLVAYKHSSLSQFHKIYKLILAGLVVCCLLTLIGTQARSGLVALFVLLMFSFFKSKSKIKTAFLMSLIPIVFVLFAPASFFDRMSTLSNASSGQESSAQGRIVVWRWTLDYVKEKPFMGGGFYAYLANAGQLHLYASEGEVVVKNRGGKASHSILFEVLGEHGYVGLVIFLSMLAHAYLLNRKRDDNIHYKTAINLSLLTYCAGGLFINVAFYPWIYYMYGLSVVFATMPKTENEES